MKNLIELFHSLEGLKTYLAAAGFLGLALFQISTSDFEGAYQSFLAALAAFGLRQAVAKNGHGA